MAIWLCELHIYSHRSNFDDLMESVKDAIPFNNLKLRLALPHLFNVSHMMRREFYMNLGKVKL